MEMTSVARSSVSKPKSTLGQTIKKRLIQAVALPSFLPIPSICAPLNNVDAELIDAFAEPGDILLVSDKNLPLYSALAKAGLGSDFGHVALYAGDGKIIESGPGGVSESEIFESGSHFTLVKPEYQSDEDREKAVEYARSMVGKPYDWTSTNPGDSVNCTDLVVNALDAGETKFDIKETSILGTRAVTPQAFLENDKLDVAVDGDLPLWKEALGALPFIALTVAGGVAGHSIGGAPGAVIGTLGTYLGANVAATVAEELLRPSLASRPWAQEEADDSAEAPTLSAEELLKSEATDDPSKPLLLQPEWAVPTETTTQALDRLKIRI